MKNIIILAVTVLLTFSSCSSYTMSGAAIGGMVGSAIGGLAGGPRGSDIGTLVGAVTGASMGAAAEAKEQAEYVRRERMRAEQYYYDEMYNTNSRENRGKRHFVTRENRVTRKAASDKQVRRQQARKSYRFEIVDSEPGQKRTVKYSAPADSASYSETPLYDDEIKME